MDDRFIYCQRNIPPEKWRYGLRTSAATGCGWIAVYNALRIMSYKPAPERVIQYFERQIPVVNGNMGTFKYAPALFFRKMGFSVTVCHSRDKFDKIAEESDAVVLFYWWRKKLRIGSHFVALHRTATGFTGYNTYTNSTGPDRYGPSLEEFLKKKGYFGRMITAVRKK